MRKYFPFIVLAIASALLTRCEKLELKPVTKVITGEMAPLATSVTVAAKIIDLSGEGNIDHGICYAKHDNPTVDDQKQSKGEPKLGDFSVSIEGLDLSTLYYVRAYCYSAEGVVYGNANSITTLDGQSVVSTTPATSITATTATIDGTITSDGGSQITVKGLVWGASPNPTLENCQGNSLDDSSYFSIKIQLSNLEPNTTYYARVYATNSIGTFYGNQVTFTTKPGLLYNGYTYAITTINNRDWLAENLRNTQYNDGSNIPLVTDDNVWMNLSAPAYCWYENNKSEYGETYGALYNWYAVNTGKLCPVGWHVPTDSEWYAMENYVDPTINDPTVTGWRGSNGASRLNATTGWCGGISNGVDFSGNGIDSFGFSALPGGKRYEYNGTFCCRCSEGRWWTSSIDETFTWDALTRSITLYNYDSTPGVGVLRNLGSKEEGLAVRCIRD